MDNWEYTLLAQFSNSPSLMNILEGFNQSVDPSTLIDTFIADVLNPGTATSWGLDVWGRIVGVGRVYQVASSGFLGFDEADDGSGTALPMGSGIFYSGTAVTENYALTDEWYRKLIFAKAQANISSGSISDINSILMSIFSDSGKIWVEETDEDTMTIKYNWTISAIEAAIIEQSGVIMRQSTTTLDYKYSSEV